MVNKLLMMLGTNGTMGRDSDTQRLAAHAPSTIHVSHRSHSPRYSPQQKGEGRADAEDAPGGAGFISAGGVEGR